MATAKLDATQRCLEALAQTARDGAYRRDDRESRPREVSYLIDP